MVDGPKPPNWCRVCFLQLSRDPDEERADGLITRTVMQDNKPVISGKELTLREADTGPAPPLLLSTEHRRTNR